MALISIPAPSHAATERPVAPEHNPPGDIPDTQVFVVYRSPLGFVLKVPEGWARRDRADGADFTDKLDGVSVTVAAAPGTPPDRKAIEATYVPAIEKSHRAPIIGKVEKARLPAGFSWRVSYTANSDPNPVTSKQVRMEHETYLFFRNGKVATLDLSAPAGADNVDQWALMARSFQWR